MMGAQPGENLDYGEEEALVSMVWSSALQLFQWGHQLAIPKVVLIDNLSACAV
jgi:hypothetical protein